MSNNDTHQHLCIFCNASESTIKYSTSDIFGDKFTINQCHSCRAFFLAPQPTSAQLERAYDSSYYGEQEEKFSSPLIEKVLDLFRKGRARRVARFVPEGGKILDIGCGNGRFLKYLLRFGKCELYGTEMEGNSAKRASRISEIKLKTGTLEANDFPENYFDAISLFHVFEHLTKPQETLNTISKILKPNGIVVVSFPNIASFQARIFKGKWLHLDPPRHLFFFEPHIFIKMMRLRGFKLENQRHILMEQNPFGMAQSILNCFQKKREVLFESLKGNKNYVKEYSKFNLFFQKLFFGFTMPIFIVADFFASIFGKSATIEIVFRKKEIGMVQVKT